MVTLTLTPVDNNTLNSNLLFRQLDQNSINLEIDATNASANITPKLRLDGAGRAYLSGSLNITQADPTVGMPIFYLPSFLSLEADYVFQATDNSAGTLSPCAIQMVSGSSGIKEVVVTASGNYPTLPTIGTSGPGSGATFSTEMGVASAGVSSNQSGSGSYAPNDLLTVVGGTHSSAATLRVNSTLMHSLSIVSGGTGGTPGTQTIVGTTGTGTKFNAIVTVSSGGTITVINSISVSGQYTVNPTNLSAEPVSGAGLVGATMSLIMGVDTVSILTSGNYTALPANAAATTTTGSGTGATLTLGWAIEEIVVLTSGEGYDSSSGITISGSGGGSALIVLGSLSNQISVVMATAVDQDDIIILDGIIFFVNSYN